MAVKKIGIFSLTYLACLFISIIILNCLASTPDPHIFKSFITQAISNFYNYHHNTILAPSVAGINFYRYIFAALIFSFLFLHVSRHIFINKILKNTLSAQSILLSLSFIAYFFVIIPQTSSLMLHFRNDFRFYSGLSTEQKYVKILKPIYLLSKHTKLHLPGYHKASLITDLNIRKDPDALYFRMMALFLYPIDIRNIQKNKPQDLVLIFFKENAVDHIPDGYELMHTFNDHNILAIIKK